MNKVKFAALTALSRQVEGEFVLVKIVAVNKDPQKLAKMIEEADLPRTQRVNDIDYTIEYGVLENIELDLEE